MAANYQNAAWFYDALSKLVYGNAIIDAQLYLLKFIPTGSKILIIGGGTGWVLDELSKVQPSGLSITYVEVAKGMMKRSKKRNTADNEVIFITDAIENITFPSQFDVVLTPFLFDNFNEQNMQRIFNHIHTSLKPAGLWLNASFQLTGKWWQRLLLRTMLLFFKIVCNNEASCLPQINRQFHNKGLKRRAERFFFNSFIAAKVYRNNGDFRKGLQNL